MAAVACGLAPCGIRHLPSPLVLPAAPVRAVVHGQEHRRSRALRRPSAANGALAAPAWRRVAAGVLCACAEVSRQRRRGLRSLWASKGKESQEEEDDEDGTASLVDMLIKKSRSSSEVVVTTADWHTELYDEAPEGYLEALNKGVELVEVVAGSTALKLVADADPQEPPRFCMRLEPRTTLGLGLIVNKQLVKNWCVLGPLDKSLRRLGIGDVEMLTLHSNGAGGMSFPSWVYDAAYEAYREGMCTKIGVSHKNITPSALRRAYEELQRRGLALSGCFVQLSLLDRKALPLVQECKALGVQVFAREALGRDELASGRFTAANPTGGDISIPRFTLAQLIPLAPVHEALSSVAQQARGRIEKAVDTTQVALQWVRSKGASPICEVTSDSTAKALPACKGWALTDGEVAQLDKAADEVEKGRRWK